MVEWLRYVLAKSLLKENNKKRKRKLSEKNKKKKKKDGGDLQVGLVVSGEQQRNEKEKERERESGGKPSQGTSGYHHMYKEYRDTTLNSAAWRHLLKLPQKIPELGLSIP
ncbi:unnamed protein product [Camellia sinensis]